MDELVKIAPNGQWSLEKSSDDERKKMIEEFLARKAAAAANKPAPRPAASGPNYPAGMRPAQVSTQNHKVEPGNEAAATKQRIDEIRAMIDKREAAAKQAKPATKDAEFNQARTEEIERNNNRLAAMRGHGETTVKRLDALQAKDDEAVKRKAAGQSAWKATVQFLGEKEGGKYKNLATSMASKEAAASGTAPPKPELMPPTEFTYDGKGGRVSQIRQGRFHNEGAVTRGKIVHKGVAFEDKATGEKKYTSVPQVEQHHWSWDHNDKKWNHVKTTYGNPSET